MKQLISVPIASELSGIPYGTLLRLIHESKLPAVKLPGRRSYLVETADLDALIQASKSGTDNGTEAQRESAQVKQNAAPGKKGQRVADVGARDNKFKWMKGFTNDRQQA